MTSVVTMSTGIWFLHWWNT